MRYIVEFFNGFEWVSFVWNMCVGRKDSENLKYLLGYELNIFVIYNQKSFDLGFLCGIDKLNT